MQIHNKLEDLSKVFDRTWKANHNDDVKNAREREKKFIDKMFNVKKPLDERSNITVDNSPSTRANNLHNNMNSMNNFNRQNRVNNIKGKFN